MIHAYPCNRGIKDNVSARGWHHFEASPFGVVCKYCGERAKSEPLNAWPWPRRQSDAVGESK